MAQSSKVPPFGNWESEENYTDYFDNARKKKGVGRMNSNDTNDNSPPIRAPPLKQEGQMGTAATIRSKHERRTCHEEGQLRRLNDSPLHRDTVGQTPVVDSPHQRYDGVRSAKVELEARKPRHGRQPSHEEGELRRPVDSLSQHENVGRRATVDSPHHRPGMSEAPKRVVSRQSGGSDRSIDNSPLHANYQARTGGKVGGVSSPSWERKGSSEGSHGLAPSTPGRSRLRPVTRGDDSPDHGPAVPKFGDWDESDPTSAEGYTQLFNRIRDEKQIEEGKVPAKATETSYYNGQRRHKSDNSKTQGCWCFPWGGK